MTRSIRAITVANRSGEPGQTTRAVNAAAAANSSQRPILRVISASLAITSNPPASHANRLNPDGAAYDSAQIACAQSRRPPGTSRNAAAAAARLSLPTTPPRRPLPTPARSYAANST